MLTPQFLVYLSLGTLAMLVPLLICASWYGIKPYKCVIIAIMLTVVGTSGTYLFGFIENQFRFGSRSFYGAVFLIPVIFGLAARLLRVSYGDLMDLSAPAVCVMLVLMKVLCKIEGCCGGRELFVTAEGISVFFPSQIVELVNALILSAVLLVMSRKERFRGRIYPWYLVIYGCTRFVLNIFREAWATKEMLLPFGNIWSLVAILIGVVWLIAAQRKIESTGSNDDTY